MLLALLDADHVDHGRAHAFLNEEISQGWASCPITQNGFIRVITQPRYPSPVSSSLAIQRLQRACATVHHSFWPCDLSLLDPSVVDASRIHGHRQITDAYLLALAVGHAGRLITFDRSVPLGAVTGSTPAHLVVL